MSRTSFDGSRSTVLVTAFLGGVLLVLGLVALLAGPGGRGRGRAGGGEDGAGIERRSGGGAPAAGRSSAGRSSPGRGDETMALDEAGAGQPSVASAEPRVTLDEPGEEAVARVAWGGTLTDAATREPVAGARIELTGVGRSVRATSDEEGSFTVSWYADVPADLAVQHPDYIDLRVPELDLEAEATFALTRSARILGRIEPAPAAGGALALAWHQVASSDRFWTRCQAEVAEDGSFVLADLDPGEYAVTARVPGESVSVEYGVTVETGQDVELRLEAIEGAVLHGRVLRAETFEPVPDVEIELRPGGKRLPPMIEELRTFTTTTDAGGSYEISGLGPGRYRTRVGSAEGDALVGALDVPADGLTIEHDFELPGPARLSGEVVGADGAAVAGARVVALRMADGDRIRAARTASFDEDTPETRAGSDGGFTLESVPTGRTLVVLGYPPDFDASREGSVAPGSLVLDALEPGQILGGLVIEIPPGERIVGSVHGADGEALAGAAVSAERRFGERSVTLGVEPTDADGRFVIQPLLPGHYRVKATLQGYWGSGEELDIGGGVDAEVELVLDPTETVRGIARDREGAGVPDLPIRIRLDQGPEPAEDGVVPERPTTFFTTTDAFGRFRCDELYSGSWSVFASSYLWEFVRAEPDGLFLPGDSLVEITMEPRNRLERFSITGVVALQEGGIPTGVRVEGFKGGFLEVDGGDFKATGLVPTRHFLWVSADGHARAKVDPVDPVPGGTVDVGRIELLPATRLTVRVSTKGGEPVEDATVHLEPLAPDDGGAPGGRRLVLNALGEGRYRTNQATRFRWRLRVRHPDHRTVTRRLQIQEGPRQSVDVVLD